MSRDPLAPFWVHSVQIARLTGQGSYGPSYADPETVTCFVDTPDRTDAGTRLVTNAQGEQVVSGITVFAPKAVADVPAGSIVTLPAAFGSRQATVIAFVRHELAGTPGMPEHIQLDLQ